jgi:hypothetical protein
MTNAASAATEIAWVVLRTVLGLRASDPIPGARGGGVSVGLAAATPNGVGQAAFGD